MLRIFKSTRDSAVRFSARALTQLKAPVILAPADLRESLEQLVTGDLVLHVGWYNSPMWPAPAQPRGGRVKPWQLASII